MLCVGLDPKLGFTRFEVAMLSSSLLHLQCTGGAPGQIEFVKFQQSQRIIPKLKVISPRSVPYGSRVHHVSRGSKSLCGWNKSFVMLSQDTITFASSISLPVQFSVGCWVSKDCSLFTLREHHVSRGSKSLWLEQVICHAESRYHHIYVQHFFTPAIFC